MPNTPVNRRRYRYQQTFVYVCLVLVVVFSFHLDRSRQAQATKDLCIAGVDSRNVQRAMVEAIYNLATGTISRDPSAPPLTAAELAQYNSYIERVNNFRSMMYKQIKPSEVCAPYVDDDNVQPPTPPTPPIKEKTKG